jgi:MYXO-CTERM domain-containing protein
VPHIAADSAGDSWVPWFIVGLVALGAAGAALVYRNRRRAAQS